MPVAEARIAVVLSDGKKRTMVFNANTMCAYEEATGKFFLDTVARLYDALKVTVKTEDGKEPSPDLKDAVAKADDKKSGMEIMRRVPMTDLRALLWASLHEYDEIGEPYWPESIAKVGRVLNFGLVPAVFLAFISGQSKNAPGKDELGESPAPPREGGEGGAKGAGEMIGGGLSTESLEDALG